MLSAPLPLTVVRNISDPALANVTVPLANPGLLHRLVDPDAGDTLFVVTAPPPNRGFIKRQDFVELSLLELIDGLVVHPNSDDIKAEVGADKVVLGKPGGLTLSSADARRTRDRRRQTAVRRRGMAQEPGGEFSPPARRADGGRCRGRARYADAGAARSRQFLHGARHV